MTLNYGGAFMARRFVPLALAAAALALGPPRAAAQIQGVDSMFVRGAYSIALAAPRCPCLNPNDTTAADTAVRIDTTKAGQVSTDSTHKGLALRTSTFLGPRDTCADLRRGASYLLRVVGYHRSSATRGDFTGTLTIAVRRDTVGGTFTDTTTLAVTGQVEVAATGPTPRRGAWIRFTATSTRTRPPRDIFDAALAARRGAAEFTGSFEPLPFGGARVAGTMVHHQPILGSVPEQPIPLAGCGGLLFKLLR
jgi:hypothetical protein